MPCVLPGSQPDVLRRRPKAKSAGVDSNVAGIKKNPDGGATVWFGPKAPAGNEANWVQTMPGKGYNVVLRLYGPLEPWFNQTWQPGDLELQN